MICPTCKREFIADPKDKSYPFCSARCQLCDLYSWLNEEYFIPEIESEEEE